MTMAPPTVMWFRRDLRLADNLALNAAAAASAGEVVPLYVIDPRLFARAGAPRRAFLVASLRALGASMGKQLVVRHGDPVAIVDAVAAEVGAAEVFAAHDFGPYGRRRDAAVAERLSAAGHVLRLVGSNYAVAPGRVRKDDGTPYAVFTPFAKVWERVGWDAPSAAPSVLWRGDPRVPCEGYPTVPDLAAELPAAGEIAAWDRLHQFLDRGGAHGYAEQRDRPGVDGTSRLSPYLRWGALHPRQVLAELGDEAGHRAMRGELAWREFYADVLFHRPDTATGNLQRAMDGIELDGDDTASTERYAAWCEGRTGYPIVDAGMRQLLATGWMHNRVRMIVASFLVKDLHLPWTWGARHFMDHLVDGDVASNSHGWQWVAGTGTDAAPYFRVFNPVSQGQRFDPEGAYVRRWVPELAELAVTVIHAPWTSRRGPPLGYPPPIVDHATERQEALRRYGALRASSR